MLVCVCLRGCAVHHLAFAVQPMGNSGMGHVIAFACGGEMEYCASQNFMSKARLKKFLIDNHDKTIYGSVRSESSSCTVCNVL